MRPSRTRGLWNAIAIALAVAGGAVTGLAVAGGAAAAAVTCPTVDPVTHVVSPPPAPGVNWSGCNLNNADLSLADLSGADLASAKLSGADMASANLDAASMSMAVLGNVDLTDANLTNATLQGAALYQTELAGVSLNGANLSGTQLYLVRSGGITGTPGDPLPAGWSLTAGYLIGPLADLSGADLAGVNLAGADLSSATALSADMTGADLANADLRSVTLSRANLSGANLTNADLSGPANLSAATLTGATLSGAKMTWDTTLAGVASGQLEGVPASLPPSWSLTAGYLIGPQDNLVGAQLAGVHLASVDLFGSDLTNADLTGADVYGASLEGTTLSGTRLAGANLKFLSSGQVTGTPASLPADWALVNGYLLGPTAVLVNASLPGAGLSSLHLAGLYAYSANLTGVHLDDADLTGATFINSDLSGATFTGATLTGVSWTNTRCPDGTNSDKYLSGCFSGLDTTPPVVTVTGVRQGQVYAIGAVPRAGCQTTDDSAVAVPATLSVTKHGAKGTGLFTATCYGAVDRAGNTAAPVSVTYKVAYGFGGFIWPRPGATVSRSGGTLTVLFRLTGRTAAVIPDRVGSALARAHEVRVTLTGPGITAVTVACGWNSDYQYFHCRVDLPAGIRAGASHRYKITALENPRTGLIRAPATGDIVNPEFIHFK